MGEAKWVRVNESAKWISNDSWISGNRHTGTLLTLGCPSAISWFSGSAQGLPTTISFPNILDRLQWMRKTQEPLVVQTQRSNAQKENCTAACSHQFIGITGQLLVSNCVLAPKMDNAPLTPWISIFMDASSTAPQVIKAKCQSLVPVTWLMTISKPYFGSERKPGKWTKLVAIRSFSLPGKVFAAWNAWSFHHVIYTSVQFQNRYPCPASQNRSRFGSTELQELLSHVLFARPQWWSRPSKAAR